MLSFDTLGTPNAPALCIPNLVGVMYSFSNQAPDTAVGTPVIPLKLKSYNGPSKKMSIDPVGAAPSITHGGNAYPNKAAVQGVTELTKAVLEGEIDTPTIKLGTFMIPRIALEQMPLDLSWDLAHDTAQETDPAVRITWGQLITMLLEGEFSDWERVDPLWFRDPFGRVYNSPRIISFEASYVEQVPCRNTFSMTLKI